MASQVTELAERTQSVGTRRRSLKRWGPAVALPALLLAIAFGLLAQVTPARAATLDVCPGTGTYTTIQAAVDAAHGGRRYPDLCGHVQRECRPAGCRARHYA